MTRIRLRPGSVVLPSDGALTVLTSRGTFELRARGVERLYARITGPLGDGVDDDALVAAAAPAHQPAVRGFLDQLARAGAIVPLEHERIDAPLDVPHLAAVLASVGVVRVVAGGRRVTMSTGVTDLSAAERLLDDADLCVLLAGPAVVRALTIRAEWPQREPRRVVCADMGDTTDGLPSDRGARAAHVAVALALHELAQWGAAGAPGSGAGRIRVCRWDAVTGEVIGRALLGGAGDALHFAELAGAVCTVDVAQMPLAVMQATWVDAPAPVLAAAVRASDARWGAAAAVLVHRGDSRTTSYTVHPVPGGAGLELRAASGRPESGSAPAADAVHATRARSTPTRVVARTWPELRRRLREEAWFRTRRTRAPGWRSRRQPHDLLAGAPGTGGGPDAEFLANVLALHHAALPGWCTRLEGGLWIVGARGRRAYAFDPARAYAALAMRLVWDAYHAGTLSTPMCAPYLVLGDMPEHGRSRSSDEASADRAVAGLPRLRVRRHCGLGITAWEALFDAERGRDRPAGTGGARRERRHA